MIRPLLFVIIILTAIDFSANGQWPAGVGLEGNWSMGRVIRHTWKFRPSIPVRAYLADFNVVFKTSGRQDWHIRRSYPVWGIGFAVTDYGDERVLGRCYGLYPNLQLPVVRFSAWEWTIRLGFGLGYVTRRYSRFPDWDTVNNVIGSHINNYTCIATNLRWHVNKHIDVQAGVDFSHVSNASLRMPNLGINKAGFQVGFRYFPTTSNPERQVRTLKPLRARILGHVRFGISATEYGSGNGPLFPVYMVSAYASKRYRSKNKVIAGLDYARYPGIYAFLRNNEILIGQEWANAYKSSFFMAHEFQFGRIGILLQIGYYLKDAYLHTTPYYQKLGANVYLMERERGMLKELTFAVLLKSHRANAELVELGMGLGF